jgi:hypothetical protein
LPHLADLADRYGPGELRIVIVDASNRREMTGKALEEAGVSMTVLVDDKDVSGEEYGVFATPTTFIVDGRGRLVFKHIGFSPGMEHMFEKEINLLLQRRST